MARKYQGSTLMNGKKGLYPPEVLEFDLSDPDFADEVREKSILRVRQIEALLVARKEVFERSNCLVWNTILMASENIKPPLIPEYLPMVYTREGLELSLDNLFKYSANDTGFVLFRALGDSLSFYVDACYKHYVEKTLTLEDFERTLEGFLCGLELMTTYLEPLISAGWNLSTHQANEHRKTQANYKRERALELRLEFIQAHPNKKLSNSWIAKRVAKILEDELNANVAPGEKRVTVSPKTIQHYYKGLSYP
ncbi:hypothetical protein JCM19232_5653 [Vibrio ishigakensis]|uniref:Uncharacterized protein n=1 Tax=Vibrio ishigakensis TaxID=1481914 RepID=A0A0B8P9U6_9VIBR|nr:hypothetical protein JCM19232_5653 [Vibrio ishigakensis]